MTDLPRNGWSNDFLEHPIRSSGCFIRLDLPRHINEAARLLGIIRIGRRLRFAV
jgi:hypothetical protein